MTTIVLEPPCALINANDRLHHHAKAKLTRAWREAARAAIPTIRPIVRPPASPGHLAVLAGFEPNTYSRAHITVSIRFATNHRRDVGNYYPTAKACLDGIVDSGLLRDDSDDHITGPDLRRERPNGPLRVTVTITEEPA
jgi:crossover junction endodeoxyribonuclease RusA